MRTRRIDRLDFEANSGQRRLQSDAVRSFVVIRLFLLEAVRPCVHAVREENSRRRADDRIRIAHRASTRDDIQNLGGVASERDYVGLIGVGQACAGGVRAATERGLEVRQTKVIGVCVIRAGCHTEQTRLR